jgi:hypothetical protein
VPLFTSPCSTAQAAKTGVSVAVQVMTEVAASPATTVASAACTDVRSASQPNSGAPKAPITIWVLSRRDATSGARPMSVWKAWKWSWIDVM